MILAIFGIDNAAANLVVNLLLVCFVALWFATAYWTYADARRRMVDPVLIGSAFAGAAIFPFVGALVYMIVRPPESLEDARERELEMQAAEARLYETGLMLCPGCDAAIEREFLVCPGCSRRLKDPCRACKRPLEPAWRVCPYCEADVRPTPAAPRRRRRAKTAAAGKAATAGNGKAAAAKPAVTEAPPPSA
jgi:hypothetical protein